MPVTPDPVATDPGSAAGSAEPQKRKDPPKPKTYEQLITSAVGSRLSELRGCLNQYPDSLPAKGKAITAQISIGANGRTKSVSLSPDALDASPLGACFKNVIKATEFPKGRDTQFSVPLSPKSS